MRQIEKNTILAISAMLLSLISISWHVRSAATDQLPRKSFTKVERHITLNIPCEMPSTTLEDEDGAKVTSTCENAGIRTKQLTASGAVIGKRKSKSGKWSSYVLTAAHACFPDKFGNDIEFPEDSGITMTSELTVLDSSGHAHVAVPVTANFHDIDACILLVRDFKGRPVKISKVPPRVGDRVLNLSAPWGIATALNVPTFEGIFSGVTLMGHYVYTFPALPGSSGSPVFNDRGRLIGLVHSADRRIETLAIASNYFSLKTFIEKSLNLHTAFLDSLDDPDDEYPPQEPHIL